jgi:hypothetical protein
VVGPSELAEVNDRLDRIETALTKLAKKR